MTWGRFDWKAKNINGDKSDWGRVQASSLHVQQSSVFAHAQIIKRDNSLFFPSWTHLYHCTISTTSIIYYSIKITEFKSKISLYMYGNTYCIYKYSNIMQILRTTVELHQHKLNFSFCLIPSDYQFLIQQLHFHSN